MSEAEEDARDWLVIAGRDFRAFEYLAALPETMVEVCSFHAQQAVEKWLKGLLVKNEHAEPFTHDLAVLIKMLAPFYPGLENEEWVTRAKFLTEFAVRSRYIGHTGPLYISLATFSQVEETLLAFRSFAKEAFGDIWVE